MRDRSTVEESERVGGRKEVETRVWRSGRRSGEGRKAGWSGATGGSKDKDRKAGACDPQHVQQQGESGVEGANELQMGRT